MKRIALPDGSMSLVDDKDYETLSAHKWHILIGRSTAYAVTHKNRKTIYMHRMIMGLVDAPRNVCVDHTDGNGLNNCRTNLCVTNNRGNQQKTRKNFTIKWTSSYTGVHKIKNKTNPWVARIKLLGKEKYLGSYRTEAEAAIAYNNAAIEHFGEHVHLNVIGP